MGVRVYFRSYGWEPESMLLELESILGVMGWVGARVYAVGARVYVRSYEPESMLQEPESMLVL